MRGKVKIKDINIKLFYKFLLIIKSWYICCGLHLKTLHWKFLIFIIQFFRGETDQVRGTSLMLSSAVKFGQILPIWSTHFGFFLPISIEICHEIWLISITYITILQFWKKNCQNFYKLLFQDHIWVKTRPAETMPKIKFNFFLEITRGDHKLLRDFLFHQNISFDWVMDNFPSCMTFCCHFRLKQTC